MAKGQRRTVLDEAVWILRTYASTGRKLRDPRKILNDEMDAYIERGAWGTASHLGSSNREVYQDAVQDAQSLAFGLWKGRSELSAPALLATMLERERPRPDIDLGPESDWHLLLLDKPLFEQFFRFFSRWQSQDYNNPQRGRHSFVMTPEQILCAFDRMTMGESSVLNPLVALRMHEERCGEPFEGPLDRPTMLEELEDLSKSVWHMATMLETDTVRTRLLLADDDRAHKLSALVRYHDLLCLREAFISQEDFERERNTESNELGGPA